MKERLQKTSSQSPCKRSRYAIGPLVVRHEVMQLPPDPARLACQIAGDLTKCEAICWAKRSFGLNIRHKQNPSEAIAYASEAEPVPKLMSFRDSMSDPMYGACTPVGLLDVGSSSAETCSGNAIALTPVLLPDSQVCVSVVGRLRFNAMPFPCLRAQQISLSIFTCISHAAQTES